MGEAILYILKKGRENHINKNCGGQLEKGGKILDLDSKLDVQERENSGDLQRIDGFGGLLTNSVKG
jgi:hypothetical protein